MKIKGNDPWDGSGEKDDPFLLKTENDLAELSDQVLSGQEFNDIYFKLENDITMKGTTWIGIGNDYISFQGHFDGNAFCISNVVLKDGRVDSGFFGCIGMSGEVVNLTVKCLAKFTHYGNTVGAIAGSNYGIIEQCHGELHAEIEVLDKELGLYLGGITGVNQIGGNLKNSTSDVNIKFTSEVGKSAVDFIFYIGGITGDNQSIVNNCKAKVNWDISMFLEENFCVGGLTGRNSKGATMKGCEVEGTMKSSRKIYGLVKENQGTVNDSITKTELEVLVETADGIVYATLADQSSGTGSNNKMEGGVKAQLTGTNAKVKTSGVKKIVIYSFEK